MEKYCGLDVHKGSVFMCILNENNEKYEEVFGTLTPELERLRDALVDHGVGQVAMESTSIYWYPVWRVLETDFDVKLVNPLFIKQLPGRKSDVRDAEWIATVLMKGLVRGSFVPPGIIQQLRMYNRKIINLSKDLRRSEQGMDLVLQRCNMRLSNYLSDIGSKSMRKVAQSIAQGDFRPEHLLGLVHKRIITKHSAATIHAALCGHFTPGDLDMLKLTMQEIDFLENQISFCKARLLENCRDYFGLQMELMVTIPGVQEHTAASIISEIGTNMNFFPSASALVGWAGLRPRNDQSAGKIKGRKTLHGNKYLRLMLVQSAWGASRTKGSPFMARYQRLRKRMHHNKALIANARKLLVVAWNILAKKEPYFAKAT